jgi:hypothetical protein
MMHGAGALLYESTVSDIVTDTRRVKQVEMQRRSRAR